MTITDLPPYLCQVCGTTVDYDDAVLVHDNGGRLILVCCQTHGITEE